MRIYLMRHAEPESGSPMDPARGITERGHEQIATMAEFLIREIGTAGLVMTSTFRRAIDTGAPIAGALGCVNVEPVSTLNPDAKPESAWEDIATYAQLAGTEEVIVITHHPLIASLAEHLCGAKTDDVHFRHCAVMCIDGAPGTATLRWFVSPSVIRRDEMGVDEALQLAESLKHQKHAEILLPLRTKAAGLMAKLFRKQKRAVLKLLRPKIKAFVSREADDDERIQSMVPDSLSPLSFSLAQAKQWDDLIAEAIRGAVEQMAGEIGATGAASSDAMGAHLRNNSLEKLTGGLDQTTLKRIRDAIANTYESGGGYLEVIDAVTAVFDDATEIRAQLIAQTELNDAYNAGRSMLAEALGFDEKSWECDGPTPCPECLGNQLQGWIPFGEEFLSGDMEPTAHPGCFCTLDFRKSDK